VEERSRRDGVSSVDLLVECHGDPPIGVLCDLSYDFYRGGEAAGVKEWELIVTVLLEREGTLQGSPP